MLRRSLCFHLQLIRSVVMVFPLLTGSPTERISWADFRDVLPWDTKRKTSYMLSCKKARSSIANALSSYIFARILRYLTNIMETSYVAISYCCPMLLYCVQKAFDPLPIFLWGNTKTFKCRKIEILTNSEQRNQKLVLVSALVEKTYKTLHLHPHTHPFLVISENDTIVYIC